MISADSVRDLRVSRPREYLMCPPERFAVAYSINPWMDPAAPVDTDRALAQWTGLRDLLVELGHTVYTLAPLPELPDMVFAANGAFSVDGTVFGARFRYPQRTAEAGAHERWYTASGWRYVPAAHVNEGEGDFAYVPAAHGGVVLAGYGYRTEPPAHAEAQEVFGRPVVSLRLTDPRFYHLDTALAAISDDNVAYYPDAFSPASRRVLAELFPDAVLADEADALAFGLNLVSDNKHVVLPAEAAGMAAKLGAAGYAPIPVDLGELKKGGGSVKCCIAELRA
ncbi:dimethylargininase [Luedemannella helvata]|uniref:dimethylargininase n=1 Tax=Luedemannella helvata TaxID=349315 RepID=UPI0031DB2C7D